MQLIHTPRGAEGEAPRKVLSFTPTGSLETCFYGQENSRKRNKQKKRHNYI